MFNTIGRSILLTSCSALVVACGAAETETKTSSTKITAPSVVEEPVETAKVSGNNEFEAWSYPETISVLDSVKRSPNGTYDADTLILPELVGMSNIHRDISVSAGDTYTSTIWLWGNEGDEIVLSIVRSCGATPGDFVSKKVTISSEPKEYHITHSFMHDHQCFLTQIQGVQEKTEVTAYAYNVKREF